MRISDWSSDVCSSDLKNLMVRSPRSGRLEPWPSSISCRPFVQDSVDRRQLEDLSGIDEVGVADLVLVGLVDHRVLHAPSIGARLEVRSVGKECVSTGQYRGTPYH